MATLADHEREPGANAVPNHASPADRTLAGRGARGGDDNLTSCPGAGARGVRHTGAIPECWWIPRTPTLEDGWCRQTLSLIFENAGWRCFIRADVGTMPNLLRSFLVLALLCGSTAVGIWLKSQLLTIYAQPETLDFINVIIAFLVTIAAIVIGLLMNTAKNFVDITEDYWARYAAQLIRLDRCLINYGAECDAIRGHLQGFTASAIANSWRTEPVAPEVNHPDVRSLSRLDAEHKLTAALNTIKLEILRLEPDSAFREKLAADCFEQYRELAKARWAFPPEPRNSLSAPFLRMLLLWLMAIFLSFGLRAPANPLVVITIVLSAFILSSMIFIAMDTVNPYSGFYNIPSTNMHHALSVMREPNTLDRSQPSAQNRDTA